jgi:hypothetical protein
MSIFISYRREDAAGHAGRLCDRLNAGLGGDRVFMDVEDIRPGQDFVRAIDDTVAACDHLLVLIGPRWLETLARRPDAERDYVRHEVSAGLRAGITVIPVLVAGARMPDATQLPEDLQPLARRNAVEIRDDRFDDDVARLLAVLGGSAGAPAKPRFSLTHIGVAAAAVIVAALAIGIFLRQPSEPDGSGGTLGTVPTVGIVAATPNIDGEWIAEMLNERKDAYRVGLTFKQAGNTVIGMVRYPTGEGAIRDGRIDGTAITFSTLHTPQFESSPALIQWVGTIEDNEIAVTASSDSGIANGVARRRPQG